MAVRVEESLTLKLGDRLFACVTIPAKLGKLLRQHLVVRFAHSYRQIGGIL